MFDEWCERERAFVRVLAYYRVHKLARCARVTTFRRSLLPFARGSIGPFCFMNLTKSQEPIAKSLERATEPRSNPHT